MATQGPQFPGTAASLANAGTSENAEAWVNPGNIVSDNATEAQITAATYDSPDISQILVASNFGFSVSGTVTGILVEVDRRSIIASSGKDFRVQLATGTTFATLVGSNKAVPATIWPTSTAVASYGGSADTWSASLTAAQVNDPGFAVFLSCQANIANADVGVDFVRVTVTYTPASNTTVTPTTASLTTSAFAPTVTTTNHQTATPGVASLTTATFAPAVATTDHQIATPSTASLTLSTFAPTVTVEAQSVTVTPSTATLSTATFAPTVTASDHKVATPTTRALALTAFAPTVTATDHKTVTPSTASLAMTAFAPNVVASDHKTVTPSTAALSTTRFAPTVSIGSAAAIVPSPAALTLTAFSPNVVLSDHKVVTPSPAALAMTAFAPTAVISDHRTVTPSPASLALTTFAPTVTGDPAADSEPGSLSVTAAVSGTVGASYVSAQFAVDSASQGGVGSTAAPRDVVGASHE